MGRCHSTQAGYENEVGVYQSEPSSSGDPLGCQAAGRRERFLVFECMYIWKNVSICECICIWKNVSVSERARFPSDLEWRNTWSLSISHKSKRLVLPLLPSCPQKLKADQFPFIAKSLNPWLRLVDLSSMVRWILLCGGEISTASCKTSLCLARFYLLIFFCDSKFTVSFIYVCFFESFFMNLQAQGMLKNKSQTKHSSDVNAKSLLLMFGS